MFFVKNYQLTCICHVQKKNKNLPHFFCLLFFCPTSENRQKSAKTRSVRLQNFLYDFTRAQIFIRSVFLKFLQLFPLYKSWKTERSSITMNFEILFLKFFSRNFFPIGDVGGARELFWQNWKIGHLSGWERSAAHLPWTCSITI